MKKKRQVTPPPARGEYTIHHPKEWTTVWRIDTVNDSYVRVFFEIGGYITVEPGFVQTGNVVRVHRGRLEIKS